MNYFEWVDTRLVERLKTLAKEQLTEFPDPDYGRLFWHPEKRIVHWVAGDGAGGYSAVEKRFNVPGVERVVAADEYFPKKDEAGWQEINFK